VPMPRTHDAHAARLKMEFIGLVQARHWVPANAKIKFAPLEFIGGYRFSTRRRKDREEQA
jgi:hypothetical protein